MRVSVIVICYNDQPSLNRTLAALEQQELDGLELEVVVVDDGSAVPAFTGTRSYPVRLLRQEDDGFRAAAARNLGASVATGDQLLFLDGDTAPEPRFVHWLATAAEAAGQRARGPSAGRGLAVGRRRHASLHDLPPELSNHLLQNRFQSDPSRVLSEPRWLSDGYRATNNLRNADDRSYRYVISAVLGMTRSLFDSIAGFNEEFTEYGGEDWDLAWRAWLAGAGFLHEPRAIAWHDGPDAGMRGHSEVHDSAKNRETRRLADLITEPTARDPQLIWAVPDCLVVLDDTQLLPEHTLVLCSRLLAGSDAAIWLQNGKVKKDGWWPPDDSRVQIGPPPERARSRCRFHVHVSKPVVPRGTLRDLTERGSARYPGLTIAHARDLAQGRTPSLGNPDLVTDLPIATLEAVWGGWA